MLYAGRRTRWCCNQGALRRSEPALAGQGRRRQAEAPELLRVVAAATPAPASRRASVRHRNGPAAARWPGPARLCSQFFKIRRADDAMCYYRIASIIGNKEDPQPMPRTAAAGIQAVQVPIDDLNGIGGLDSEDSDSTDPLPTNTLYVRLEPRNRMERELIMTCCTRSPTTWTSAAVKRTTGGSTSYHRQRVRVRARRLGVPRAHVRRRRRQGRPDAVDRRRAVARARAVPQRAQAGLPLARRAARDGARKCGLARPDRLGRQRPAGVQAPVVLPRKYAWEEAPGYDADPDDKYKGCGWVAFWSRRTAFGCFTSLTSTTRHGAARRR